MIKTKLNQTVIARNLGVAQATVSNWLNMRTKPSGMGRRLLDTTYPELLKRIEEAWDELEK